MSDLHITKSVPGTGSPDVSHHYFPQANSGAPKLTSLTHALFNWAQQHQRESYEVYAQCIQSIASGYFAGTRQFCSALFGLPDKDLYLSGFEEFTNPGWDGDDAKPVSKNDLKFARGLLDQIAPYLPCDPDAAAGTDGSICMEWLSNSAVGTKKIFIDVTPDGSVLTFARIGSSRPTEKHFRKNDPMLVTYLQQVFDFFATK